MAEARPEIVADCGGGSECAAAEVAATEPEEEDEHDEEEALELAKPSQAGSSPLTPSAERAAASLARVEVRVPCPNTHLVDAGADFNVSCGDPQVQLGFAQWQALAQDGGSSTSATPDVAALIALGAAKVLGGRGGSGGAAASTLSLV